MSQSNTSHQSLADRELELAMREAELNRREAALRRAEEAHVEEEGPSARASSTRSSELEEELVARLAAAERRERELERTVEAVEAQRQRLEHVRAEYEARRDALTLRTREVEAERDRLRQEQAQLVEASLELEEAFAAPSAAEPEIVEVVEVEAVAEVEAAVAAAAPVVPVAEETVVIRGGTDALIDPEPKVESGALTIDDWWAKQLGSPLEAA